MSKPNREPETKSQRPKRSTASRQKNEARGRSFAKGVSGNPAGRPRGSRNKSTLLALQLIEGEAEALAHKAVEKALQGDRTAMRLCLERLVPVQKDRAIQLDLPVVTSAQQLSAGIAALAAAVAKGEVTPEEAQKVADLIGRCSRALERADLEHRVTQLEQHLAQESEQTTGTSGRRKKMARRLPTWEEFRQVVERTKRLGEDSSASECDASESTGGARGY